MSSKLEPGETRKRRGFLLQSFVGRRGRHLNMLLAWESVRRCLGTFHAKRIVVATQRIVTPKRVQATPSWVCHDFSEFLRLCCGHPFQKRPERLITDHLSISHIKPVGYVGLWDLNSLSELHTRH